MLLQIVTKLTLSFFVCQKLLLFLAHLDQFLISQVGIADGPTCTHCPSPADRQPSLMISLVLDARSDLTFDQSSGSAKHGATEYQIWISRLV